MELIALAVGMMIRIALPAALIFWACGRLQAWDRRRSAL
jgi:hypothetical protein